MKLSDYINPKTGEGDMDMPIAETARKDNEEAERSVFSSSMSRNHRRKKIDTSNFKF